MDGSCSDKVVSHGRRVHKGCLHRAVGGEHVWVCHHIGMRHGQLRRLGDGAGARGRACIETDVQKRQKLNLNTHTYIYTHI